MEVGEVGGEGGGGVEEGDAAWVFGLGGADEAPDGCGGEVDGFGGVGGDGVGGVDDEVPVFVGVVQERLDVFEEVQELGFDGVWYVEVGDVFVG